MNLAPATTRLAGKVALGAGLTCAVVGEQIRHLGGATSLAFSGWLAERRSGERSTSQPAGVGPEMVPRRPRTRAVTSGSGRVQRRRVAAIALAGWLVLLVAAVWGLGDGSRPVSSEMRVASHGVHVVAEGESLWDVAEEVAGDADVRAVVDQLAVANDLQSSSLRVGQVLTLP